MNLCFVNVEQLRDFKIGAKLKIELIGASNNSNEHVNFYLVNGFEVRFTQNNRYSRYDIEEEIRLIRKHVIVGKNGIVLSE